MKSSIEAWQCFPGALAIVISEDPARIMGRLGHDGSKIISPNEPDPDCRQGFVADEMIAVAGSLGWRMAGFSVMANRWGVNRKLEPIFGSPSSLGWLDPFLDAIGDNGHGVLVVGSMKQDRPHAYAVKNWKVVDPYTQERCGFDRFINTRYITAAYVLNHLRK